MTPAPGRRYRAVIFHPGPLSRFLSGRAFGKTDPRKVPVLGAGVVGPDPREVILEKSFRTRPFAAAWSAMHLKRMTNVCAEIYDQSAL